MHTMMIYYRPQTKFAKVMFLHLSVILFTGGVSASVHAGIHTLLGRHTPGQTPLGQTHPWSRHPPPAHTPGQSPPPGQTPPGQTPPPAQCML